MRKNVLVLSLLLCVAWAVAASAGDNWVGTWKINTAKSDQGSGAVRATTLKFEATPEGVKFSSEGTDAEGKPTQGGYTSKFDGKDVPVTGNPMADTVSPKRIDDNTYENVWKKGGKPTVTVKVAVAKDGKTLTVTQDGTDPKGAKIHAVAVYDRQ